MMQIVIELSDETYDKIVNPNNWYDPNSAIKDIVKAIKNGIPLPKGHGRLIDADKLQSITTYFGVSDVPVDVVRLSAIRNARTVIEADKAESEVDNGNDD